MAIDRAARALALPRTALFSAATLAAATAAVVGLNPRTASAQTSVKANSDAEIREITPEFTRGNLSNPISGTGSLELQISSLPNTAGVVNTNSSNRNLQVLRFHVPNAITTSADLQNYAEMRLFFRPNSMNGSGGIRLYGLNPNNPLNTTWTEDGVMYRDAGDHQLLNAPLANPNSLVTPSVIAQPGASSPHIVAVSGYNADPNHARRAPGLLYQAAPFSSRVETENAAREAWNSAHPTQLLPYLNQPSYNVSTLVTNVLNSAGNFPISIGDGDPTTNDAQFAGRPASERPDNVAGPANDMYADVPETNMPFFSGPTNTWIDDVDTRANGLTYIGYTKVTFPANTGYGGQYLSVGGGSNPVFPGTSLNQTTPQDDNDAARANLIGFLGMWLDLGFRDFTFVVGPSVGQLNDPNADPDEIINGANLQFASKEFTPAGGVAGDYAPLLILAPEPGTATVALAGLVGLVVRRGRRRA